MKKFVSLSLIGAAVISLIITGCKKTEVSEPAGEPDAIEQLGLKVGDVVPGSYIVVLRGNEQISNLQATSKDLDMLKQAVRDLAEPVLAKYAIDRSKITFVYGKVLTGFAVTMTSEQAQALASDKDVKSVDPDRVIGLIPVPEIKKKPGSDPPPPPAEEIPWGITRVGGGVTYTGSGKAWIIDTGIDLDHPDLNVNTGLSVSYVPNEQTADDKNGHGSHVAGTIAAIDNDFGVVGVAPGAQVVAVKVLNRNGSGFWSWIIAGVDYVGANAVAGDVANMSLGGGYYQPLNTAVLNASDPCYFSLAAGNESDDAGNYSPGSTQGNYIYTVSAMDGNDNWAWFSNFSGSDDPIDYCAPGVSVYSCYKNGGYATMSGTSMAAPHVAGLRLLGTIGTDGVVSGDPASPADPVAHH